MKFNIFENLKASLKHLVKIPKNIIGNFETSLKPLAKLQNKITIIHQNPYALLATGVDDDCATSGAKYERSDALGRRVR